jgi:hypothetical protein
MLAREASHAITSANSLSAPFLQFTQFLQQPIVRPFGPTLGIPLKVQSPHHFLKLPDMHTFHQFELVSYVLSKLKT